MHRLSRWTVLVPLLAVLAGCGSLSSQPFAWSDPSVERVWPPPPDPPRIRYLRTLTGPDDFQSQRQTAGLWTWLLGERQDQLPLLTPFAVAKSAPGPVWVADNGARLLYRIDVERRRVDYIQEPDGMRLNAPSGVAVDNQRQRVYLADAAHDRIFVLDDQGEALDRWGPRDGFERPAGLAVDATGQLYVADAGSGLVQVFDPQGTLVRTIGSQLNPAGRFDRPLAVAIGPGGEIAILDALAFRIEVQDPAGRLLATIGGVGDAAGHLARPKGLAIDSKGYLFVSDSAFDNIQVFDLTGNLLMYWGEAGDGPGQFNLPAGLAIDENHRLLVADWYNHRVQVFQILVE